MPTPSYPVDEIVMELRKQRRQALREEGGRAEELSEAINRVMDWAEGKLVGPFPVDLARFGLAHLAPSALIALRNKLSELRLKANSQSLRDLDDAIRLARELRTAEVLDEATFEQVQELENKAKAKRADLKARSGEIETMAGLGLLLEAIRDLERMIREGVYEFEDREGNIVPSAVKLAEYNQAYAAFCTQKAQECLVRAEQSLPAFPKAAVEVLNKALEEFDKADADVRAELERRRTEVQELIERWEKALHLIDEGLQEPDPSRRLSFLLRAQSRYPQIENLDDLIASTRAEIERQTQEVASEAGRAERLARRIQEVLRRAVQSDEPTPELLALARAIVEMEDASDRPEKKPSTAS